LNLNTRTLSLAARTQTSLDQVLREGRSFDVVVCFDGMQNSFASEETAELFLRSATCRLREGGYFLGFLPDSSAIWFPRTAHLA
jgi:hypothetical protein